MRYFAKIESNVVAQVIVAEQEFVAGLDGVWIETFGTDFGGPDRNLEDESQNPPAKRGYYASVGFLYDEQKDQFSPPPLQTPQFETDPAILAAINQIKIVNLP